MRKNVFWKSIIRQPVQTVFLLLLIGFISFVFTARATEYLVIRHETERIGGYYRSVGVVEPLSQYDTMTGTEEVEGFLGAISYVDFTNPQRLVSGTINSVFNTSFGGMMDVNNDIKTFVPFSLRTGATAFGEVVICGELVGYEYRTINSVGFHYIRIRVDKVEAGYPEYVHTNFGKVAGFIMFDLPRTLRSSDGSLPVVGQRYMVRGNFDTSIPSYYKKVHSDMRLLPINNGFTDDPQQYIYMLKLDTEPGAEVDYSVPELTGLSEFVTLLWQNQHSLPIIASKDMSCIPDVMEVSQRIQLVEGRLLDYDDTQNKNPVCVVHNVFANTRGLSVGDILTVDLRDLNNPYVNGSVSIVDDPLWEDYPVHTIDLEIVGLYSLSGSGDSVVYIPESLLPEDWGKLYSLSFSLLKMEYENNFLDENRYDLIAMGMKVWFLPSDADAFWASVAPLMQSALLNALIFAFLLLLALLLAVFLYLRGRRRTFAILRALGVPGGTVIKMSAAALSAVSFIAVAAGGVCSWNYALSKSRESLSTLDLPSNVIPDASLPVWWLILICSCVFLLMVAITAAGAAITAKHPVLELLQGNAARVKKASPSVDPSTHAQHTGHIGPDDSTNGLPVKPTPAASAPVSAPLPDGHGRGFSARMRYISRHIRRSGLKTALSILIPAVSVIALGWMHQTIERNEAEIEFLYNTTLVQAGIVAPESTGANIIETGDPFNPYISAGVTTNLITIHAVSILMSKNCVTDVYLEKWSDVTDWAVITRPDAFPENHNKRTIGAAQGLMFWGTGRNLEGLNLLDFTMLGLNKPSPYFTNISDNIQTEYAEGYDEGMFALRSSSPYPLMLPLPMAEALGLGLGDEVLLLESGFGTNVETKCIIAGIYWDPNGYVGVDAPILMSVESMTVRESIISNSTRYPYKVFYSKAVFDMDVAANKKLATIRTDMNNSIKAMESSITALRFIVWDEELRQVVDPLESSLRLMSILYPITIAVSVLIAAGLAILIMFQSALEAAIMRVLGSASLHVRITFCLERLILCLLGLLLGFAALHLLWQDFSLLLTPPSLLCAGLYLAGELLGSVTGVTMITRRTPLELLQVKE